MNPRFSFSRFFDVFCAISYFSLQFYHHTNETIRARRLCHCLFSSGTQRGKQTVNTISVELIQRIRSQFPQEFEAFVCGASDVDNTRHMELGQVIY